MIAMAGLAMGLLSAMAQAETRPAVVELFTSQGCSSCPPADAFLGELARRGDVIALAYHVDYWDNLGWKDPFASPAATQRQRLYGRALGLSGIYTPQMVVDGHIDAVGSDRASVKAALAGTRQGPEIRLDPANGKLTVSVSAQKGAAAAEVILVAYAEEAQTKVQRGENAGRSLTEYAIVQGVYPLGRWSGEAASYSIDLSTLASGATHAAVLVQTPGPGAIIGAAAGPIR
jgi:hypothetical protein